MARELQIGTISIQDFRTKLSECRHEVEAGAVLLVTANNRPAFGVMPLDAFNALCALGNLSPQVFADVLRNATEENTPHILAILAWVACKEKQK